MNSPRFKSQIKKLITLFLWIPVLISCQSAETENQLESIPMPKGFTIPVIDLARQTHRQIMVDREEGQSLGHPSPVLLEDQKTIICVYPKGHGKGAFCDGCEIEIKRAG